MTIRDQVFVALDLEYEQPEGHIIEVGIAYGSPSLPLEPSAKKSWLIQPPKPLSPFIQELTGISQSEMDSKGVSMLQCANELKELLTGLKTQSNLFVNPVVWGIGDAESLLESIRAQGVDFPFFGRRSLDTKTVANYLRLSRGIANPGGLSSELGYWKLSFEGSAHRAADDAYNTLRLFFTQLNYQHQLNEVINHAKSIK